MIREYIAKHGEQAFAEKEDELLARANRLAGGDRSSTRTVWEDVREDGGSDGEWFKAFEWRGLHA